MRLRPSRLKTKLRRLAVYSANLARIAPSYALFRASGRRLCRGNVHRYCVVRVASRGHTFGMTTRFEQGYLSWFGSEIYSGAGAIVDLGSWLGSTVISVSEGLERSPREAGRRARIHAYDMFVWDTWMDPMVARTALAGRFKPGDSFLDEFKRRTAHLGARVTAHPADLTTVKWTGGPIELLVVDAMKSWELARAILQNFYAAVIPGIGIVFHQDFAHYYTYWIHLIQYRLRDHFEPVCDLPESGSTVFRLRLAIPPERLAAAAVRESYGPEEIERAFAYSRGLVSRDKRQIIDTAHMTCLAEYGLIREAQQLMENLEMRFSGPPVEFEKAAEIVRERASAPRRADAGGGRARPLTAVASPA